MAAFNDANKENMLRSSSSVVSAYSVLTVKHDQHLNKSYLTRFEYVERASREAKKDEEAKELAYREESQKIDHKIKKAEIFKRKLERERDRIQAECVALEKEVDAYDNELEELKDNLETLNAQDETLISEIKENEQKTDDIIDASLADTIQKCEQIKVALEAYANVSYLEEMEWMMEEIKAEKQIFQNEEDMKD